MRWKANSILDAMEVVSSENFKCVDAGEALDMCFGLLFINATRYKSQILS